MSVQTGKSVAVVELRASMGYVVPPSKQFSKKK
jgi:hypothetical protein